MERSNICKVLTIAGSDPCGGAGIQADIKTVTAHGMYAMSVITALTAQDTAGVYGVEEVSPEFVGRQMDCVFGDIAPDAVKIGMTANADIVRMIAEKLAEYNADKVVLDPVMSATGGGSLMRGEAVKVMVDELFPEVSLITPNIPEAEMISGVSMADEGMEGLVRRISGMISADAKPAVLLKGGHLPDKADDLLYLPDEDRCVWFRADKIDNPNTHGTGCTLSSSIACGLAGGMNIEESVEAAKEYVRGGIAAGLNLGRGKGPLNHMWNIRL